MNFIINLPPKLQAESSLQEYQFGFMLFHYVVVPNYTGLRKGYLNIKDTLYFPQLATKNRVWFLIPLHCKGLFQETFIQTQVCLQCFGISVQQQPGEQKILKKNKVCLHEKAPGKFKKTPDPSDQSA